MIKLFSYHHRPFVFLTRLIYNRSYLQTNSMEIDMIDEEIAQSYTSKASAKRPKVVVDDAHPFELEAYISGYSGS